MELPLHPSSSPARSALGHLPDAPISVGELTHVIRDILEGHFGTVWVTGEVSNFRAPGSGHLYFTLKDEEACIAAVMFRGDAGRSRSLLRDGTAVVAQGRLTVYEPRGQYQLQVLQIRPRGLGTLQERFEALRNKLAQEGLFDLDRKRPFPTFPETIGVVTSLQAAALQDLLRILRRRAPGIRVLIRGVRVQGDGAALEIAEAVRAFNRTGGIDLIIVTRGGGSLEDLWAFNEEVVARALAASAIPTVAAVGHETDVTIADFVADLRAPTPSAAAELITRDWAEWRTEIAGLRRRLARGAAGKLASCRHRWRTLALSPVFREPVRVVRRFQQRLDDLRGSLDGHARRNLSDRRRACADLSRRLRSASPRRSLVRAREHLAHLRARLRNLSPQAILDRGYALVSTPDGAIVRKADPSLVGSPAHVRLARGTLHVRIDAVSSGSDTPAA